MQLPYGRNFVGCRCKSRVGLTKVEDNGGPVGDYVGLGSGPARAGRAGGV